MSGVVFGVCCVSLVTETKTYVVILGGSVVGNRLFCRKVLRSCFCVVNLTKLFGKFALLMLLGGESLSFPICAVGYWTDNRVWASVIISPITFKFSY